jgi:hypothetical protein
MTSFQCHTPLLNPVELVLRSIAQRTLAGSLPARSMTSPVDRVAGPSATPAELGCETAETLRACAGRRPHGLVSHGVGQLAGKPAGKLADFLADAAHLEAASVVAFERLADELRAHGAPSDLIAQALAARADEVKHAQRVGELARALGGEPVPVEVAPSATRSLFEVAVENAVEGCVRETYGALVGAYQAVRARDLQLRLAMRAIAADEARHASLAHAVQAWALPKLTEAEREQLRRAQVEAVFELAKECQTELDPELQEQAGLPSRGVAGTLVGELTRELWSESSYHAA